MRRAIAAARMRYARMRYAWCAALCAAALASAAPPVTPPPLTVAEILAASTATDWRRLDPDNTLYLQLPAGRVVIELAPAFAPQHIANLRKLVAARYFDGLAVVRVQDNFVAQWGDPDGKRPLGDASASLPAEFEVSSRDIPFTRLPDADGYAPQVGFSNGMPAGRDPGRGQSWLTHCYGALGVGRDESAESGSGVELYAVIGQSPRQLDRNIAVIGRVVQGMELLSSLPRGSGALGFYERPEQRMPIITVRFAAQLPVTERTPLEVFRTDTVSFQRLVESRRNRRDSWYKVPAGHIDLCNVPIPVRAASPP